MIFKKESNFPHPVLSSFTDDYISVSFSLSISLHDYGDKYRFDIKYYLNSGFINNLLNNKKAIIYLVIESKDVKFFELSDNKYIDIRKNKITLNKITQFQLFIMATKKLSFKDNPELDPFYEHIKDKIYIKPNTVLAMSTVEKFDGDLKKPYELFRKTIDPSINSEIKIEFGSELIEIKFKEKLFQYYEMRNKNALNNHYVYMGLQKALMKFIADLEEEPGEGLDLEELDDPDNKLYRKLFYLMEIKNVTNINIENIDEVIYKISDKIIEKHVNAVKEAVINEG